MIYKTEPELFHSRFEIVSCFLESGGEILLLHRLDYKPQGGTWGVPAGKVKTNEAWDDAMRRELWEETGCKADLADLTYFQKVYVRYPDYDFIYHIYHLPIILRPEIIIDPEEHKTFRWLTPEKALQENLIPDLDACVKLFYKL